MPRLNKLSPASPVVGSRDQVLLVDELDAVDGASGGKRVDTGSEKMTTCISREPIIHHVLQSYSLNMATSCQGRHESFSQIVSLLGSSGGKLEHWKHFEDDSFKLALPKRLKDAAAHLGQAVYCDEGKTCRTHWWPWKTS